MIYAKIEKEKVVNIIIADEDFANENKLIPLTDPNAGIGWTYKNGKFIAPEPVAPFPSWVFNKTINDFEAPVPYPKDGKVYDWNESELKWVLLK